MLENSCYSYNSLESYWYNLLPFNTMSQISQHLERCANCQAQLLVIQSINKTKQELQATNADFQQTCQKIEELKNSLAQLVFDSRLTTGVGQNVSGGFRSGIKIEEAPCHLLYSVDEGRIEIDMHLRQTGMGDGYSLIGQVLGVGEEIPWAVLLGLNNEWAVETSPDETGTFRFQNVPGGDYALKLFCDSEIVAINMVTL
jgi:hypothetical protein